MIERIVELPDWSKTIDPQYKSLDYTQLKSVAVEFTGLSPEARKALVKCYSNQYSFPNFDLEKASRLYLLLRVVFDLPSNHPRAKAKIFGGWLHPSIGEETTSFNLSWPVRVETVELKPDAKQMSTRELMKIARFLGYFGKGYEAIGEYEYFAKNFPFRKKEQIEKLELSADTEANSQMRDTKKQELNNNQ
jgi:hypothetical protein